jgi:hypothetical protein
MPNPDRPLRTEEVEITPEMIVAGARPIYADPFLDIGETGAELLAAKVLKCALAARGGRCVDEPKEDWR